MLYLVDHDQLAQRTKRRFRFTQPRQASRIFQVEIIQRIGRNKLTCQRSLTALSRTDERHHATAAKSSLDQGEVGRALNHVGVYHENPPVSGGISWYDNADF